MKANELRYDNLVNYEINDFFTNREPYYGKNIYHVKVIMDDRVKIELGFDALQKVLFDDPKLKPIVLTEEWLLMFGFEKGNMCYNNAHSINVRKTDFYLRPSYLGGFYWGFNISNERMDCELNDVKPIHYVHELQNLYFALTGEELWHKETPTG